MPSFAHLVGAMASWFLFWGSGQVMFQWLVVEELASPATLVGTAQMTLMMPSLFLLLVGGATADRFDPRRVLFTVHVLASTSVWILYALVATRSLTYEALLAYAASIGTLQAFGNPARDTQLSNVVSSMPLGRAVAGMTMTQHMSQMTGAFVAGLASFFGPAPVIAWMGTVLLAGCFFSARLPTRSQDPALVREPMRANEVRAGIAEVLSSPVLRPVFFVSVSTGICFIGPFLVIVPLIVRDVYGGGAGEMGVLSAMFPLGAVLGGAIIVWRGGIQRNGRALVIGQIVGAASIGMIGLGLPFEGSMAGVLSWGISGALFINTGRTIFQQNASERNRARVLSVYALALMGGSPFGSLLSGGLADPLGLHGTLLLSAASAFVVVIILALTTRLWELR